MKEYVPDNVIHLEACALIAAWEAFNSTAISLNHMDITDAPGDVVPIIDSGLAPPKRYFRTFWRSLSRRVLSFNAQL